MLGSLRLFLAAAVVVSHADGNYGGIWIGVSAVTVFYILSGFAMTGLIQSRFAPPRSFPLFYLERAVRLAPQYYFWLAAACVVSFALQWQPVQGQGFIPFGLFAYLTVIPLGIQAYLGQVTTLVMPQATTLGIEITFYVFSPWILQSRLLSWLAAAVSLGIFVATAGSLLPANIYTYYTSPGPMIFYILGSFIYKRDAPSVFALATVLLLVLWSRWGMSFDREFMLGCIFGLVTVWQLGHRRSNRLDSALGNASYGCFLGHTVVLAGLKHVFGIATFTPAWQAVAVVLSCLAGHFAFVLVERPTIPFRRRLRGSTGPVATVQPV